MDEGGGAGGEGAGRAGGGGEKGEEGEKVERKKRGREEEEKEEEEKEEEKEKKASKEKSRRRIEETRAAPRERRYNVQPSSITPSLLLLLRLNLTRRARAVVVARHQRLLG